MSYKHFRLLTLVLFALILAVSCGGGVSSNPPSQIPVALEGADGASGIAVDASFVYTFDFEVDTSTVTTSTYFIVPTASASASISVGKDNTGVCRVNYAIDAVVSSDSASQSELAPTDDLSEGTSYTACLTSGILKSTGEAIDPIAITFVTETTIFKVAAVMDGSGNPIASSGSNDVNFNSITILLTDVPSTEDNYGNIALSCGDTVFDAGDLSSISRSSIILTITDAHQYQSMDCTLTIPTDLVDTDGQNLFEAISLSFTNGCAVTDSFTNSSTQECWNVANDGDWDSWSALLDSSSGILEFSTTGLSYDSNGLAAADRSGTIGKEIAVSEDEVQIDLHVSNIDLGTANGIDTLLAGISSGFSDTAAGGLKTYIAIGFLFSEGATGYCVALQVTDVGTILALEACERNEYYLRLTINADTTTAEYSTDGVNYGAINQSEIGWPPSGYTLGDFDYIIMSFATTDAVIPSPDTSYIIKSFEVTGVTSETQY